MSVPALLVCHRVCVLFSASCHFLFVVSAVYTSCLKKKKRRVFVLVAVGREWRVLGFLPTLT